MPPRSRRRSSLTPRQAAAELAASLRSHAITLFGLLAAMWALEILDFLIPFWHLDHLGIIPRSSRGLLGIPAAPFLHGDFSHLAANSLPFLVLGGIVMLGERGLFWSVTVFVILLGGLGVWLTAPAGSVHLGASGLIFGYLGFLISRGMFERSPLWIAIGLVLLVAYGGMIFGVLPGRPGISWQGHLFGFLAGILAAWMMFPKGRKLYFH